MNSIFEFNDSTDLPKEKRRTYVNVILPLPLPQLYTYAVPFHLINEVKKGLRVEVKMGKQGLFSALIYKIHHDTPNYQTKPILSVLDVSPVVSEKQFELWEWLSNYYLCTMGEIMQAALPAGLKLNGETKIYLNSDSKNTLNRSMLNDLECQIIDLLDKEHEINLSDLQKKITAKSIQPAIKKLIEWQLLVMRDDLTEKYKPRTVACLRFAEPFNLSNPESIKNAFDILGKRSEKQINALLAFVSLWKTKEEITKKELCEKAEVDGTVISKIVEKGIFEFYEKQVFRQKEYKAEGFGNYELNEIQHAAFNQVCSEFSSKNVVLLHGVTGSGKTQIYVELIKKTIEEGKQVLYLLPEIALTVQIVNRLQYHFGNKIVVYHSKFNQNERVEIWNDVMNGRPIVLGARSALFLPFKNLGLIIVDEEHDPSFKQTDPAPRYNARDTAVYLSVIYGVKTLLGTATPSIETFRNVQTGKYGYVNMNQRFGELEMPKLMIVDLAEEVRRKRMKSNFSVQLLEQIQSTVEAGEQVILFQNRRGYAPVYQCVLCGWIAQCENCDVSLTYHKQTNDLHCHYCSYQQPLPKNCKACTGLKLSIRGFGTEKIEDDLKIYLPELKITRMDLDTVKGKDGHEKIIQRFENREVEVLVGTQMVSKGLDFDNVGLVAVMSADQLINYPDFRATERTFQLITQVAGRAGRKNKQGKVIIQAFNVSHPVLQELLKYNFDGFYKREIGERREFFYPPFSRLIQIQLKHKNEEPLAAAVNFFAEELKTKLGNQVLGPVSPTISKIRNYFIREILIKCYLNIQEINDTKNLIAQISDKIRVQKSMSNLRIAVNVDPY